MRHTAAALLAAAVLTVAAAVPAVAAGNPNGTGLPGQSCQDIVAAGGITPGHADTSPGSPFNEPGTNNPGGTGGQHYNETSQYDVACFQVSKH